MKIPILSLGSEPVIVHLSGLHVVAGPKHRESASDAEERERLERTKKRRLQLADLLGLDQPAEEEDEETKVKRLKKAEEENDSVLGKLKMKILNNIQVKIENIHIRYQDDLSNPTNPFALGITLDELYAESADENWVPGWIKRTKSTIIRKLVRLQNLCVYFDTVAKPQAPHNPTATGSQTAAPLPSDPSALLPSTSVIGSSIANASNFGSQLPPALDPAGAAPGTVKIGAAAAGANPASDPKISAASIAPNLATPNLSAPSTITGPVAPMLKLPAQQSVQSQAPSMGPHNLTTQKVLVPDIVSEVKPHNPNVKDASDIIFKFANDAQMCKVLTELTYKKSRGANLQPPHSYILAPFSAQLKLTLDISEDMAQFTRPKVQLETKVEDIQLALNQSQFFGALDLFQYFSLYINSLRYLKHRPAQLNDKTLHLPENRSKLARLRWSYIINCVRHDVREKVDSWSWSNISQRKKDRITYTEIFKRLKSDKKITSSEEEQLNVLEKLLHYEDIIVYRKLAYASIIHDKKKKKRRREKDAAPASKSIASSTASIEKDKKDKDKSKEKAKEKELSKSKEKPKEEESILDRLFGFTKSDKEKERDRQRAAEKEKAERERKEKAQREKDAKAGKPQPPPPAAAPAPVAAPPTASSTSKSAIKKDVMDGIDEDELLKELYDSIGFDNAKQAGNSDYPKDYIHTKLSFHIIRGRIHLTEVDPKLPVIATFSVSNVYTGIRLSGVSSLQLDGYVETCDMVEYHTLGSKQPFPVVQRDETQHNPDTPLQQIFSFTVGTNAPSPQSLSPDPVDLDLSILALPLLITISRPFIDRLLVFFDLYGRDDISEHISELAEKSFESMKQKAETELKYALGARKTILVNAIVHAPRIQVPSDYQDPLSSLALLDLGIITVMADTTSRPDSKTAMSRVKALRESGPQARTPSPLPVATGPNDLSLTHVDENYFYDRIVMKLSGINAGIVRKRTEGQHRHPPPKDSPEIIALLSKVDASITLSICNTQTHDLSRARLDANVSIVKVHATKAIMGVVFDVVKTAMKDTRPKDPIREAEIAEKARLRRIQLILWSEDLGEDAPALHALLSGMDAVNRRRQNLAAFLDFDDSETETETESTDTETDFSESEIDFPLDSGSARSSIVSLGSNNALNQVKDRIRHAKVRPAKQRFEFKLFEAHFKLEGVSVALAENLEGVDYPIITVSVNQLTAQLNASDQSLVLVTSLQSFAIQEHITERTSFGGSEASKGDHYIIRSMAPPDLALIHIRYEQLDRRCSRYANIDHNVKLTMQGLEITISRLTIASLIVVATELATSIQSAMGLVFASKIVDLSQATTNPSLGAPQTPNKLLTPATTPFMSDAEEDFDDSSSVHALTDDNASEVSEIEDIKKREAKKNAQLAMAKAAVQEGISLASIDLSLKEIVVQLNKEGSPFFKATISNARAQVGIYPDHTTQVEGSLSELRCSARTNEAGIPLWTVARATSEVPFTALSPRVMTPPSPIDGTKFAPPPPTTRATLSTSTTAPRAPLEWSDIIYVEGDSFGSFSLKVYDPSMPNYPGVDMDVKASVGGLRAIMLFRVVDEIITYLTAFKSMLGVIGYLQAAKSTDEPEPKTRLFIEVSSPVVYLPRSTESREFISLALGATTITNRMDTIAGVKYDFMTVNITGLGLRAVVRNTECTGLVERRILDNIDLCLSVNRAIEGNDEHLLPDVEVSSSIEQIRISAAASDLLLIGGLLGGNFSEFVLRKDEVELKEAISFLESINLVQFISNIVPLSTVSNLSTIPFVKVHVSFAINNVSLTLSRGSGVLENGEDSALLSGNVSTLDIGVIVTSDDGVQLSMNIERIEILDCSKSSDNKFRYVLLPNLGFDEYKADSVPSTPKTPVNPILARRLSVSAGMRTSRSSSISASGPLGRSSALQRPHPFFKLRYEDRPSEASEFVSVSLSHPRIFIVPYVLQELLGILVPFVTSLVTALDTWHQRLLFGSEAEQRDVLANAITLLETRHREELAQMVSQHRNQLSSIIQNKKKSLKDEEIMLATQEATRKAVIERQKQELSDLKLKGIVPKWTNPNEMRVKVEIDSPEICIVEKSNSLTSPSFIISLGHVTLRLSLLPYKITVDPNICDFGVYKAMLDATDATSTVEQVMLIQPFDVTGSIIVNPPQPNDPSSLVDVLLKVGLIHTIVSYRDIRLGVEVYRSFEPMINKIVALASDLGAVAEEAAKVALGTPQEELILQISVKKMLFSLLNDHNPLFVLPVAKVTLGDLHLLVQTNNKNVTVAVPMISADGFNNSLSSYEPLIEPWAIDLKVLEHDSRMSINVAAEQKPLNINVTRSLFDAIFGMIAFADDMKAILSPDENVRILKKGAAASKQHYSDSPTLSRVITGIIPSPPVPGHHRDSSEAAPSTPNKTTLALNQILGHQRNGSSSLTVNQLSSIGDDDVKMPLGTMANLPAGLASPGVALNNPANATSSATTTMGAERSFDPFLVRNDTNEQIHVWKTSERPDSGFTLAPGQQMSLRSQKSSKHAADTTFYVNVDITIGSSTLALEHIPIEKVHSQIYSLQNDRNVKILSEVSLQHGTKILTLSTVHYIRNNTLETIEAMIVGHAGAKHELTIPSQQTRSIPIRFCNYKEIKLRPTGGYLWYTRSDMSADSIMNCNTDDRNSNRSWSCCLNYTSRTLEGGKDYCITLSPQLILENLLCSRLFFQTYTPGAKFGNAFTSAVSSVFGRVTKSASQPKEQPEEDTLPTREISFEIDVGDSLPVFAAQAANSVVNQSFRILVPGFNWSDPVNMGELFSRLKPSYSFERAVTMVDMNGRIITFYISIHCPSTGCMRVSFFSKYWIINQTGLCLAFRTNSKSPPHNDDGRSISMTGNPRDWYEANFASENAAQKKYYSAGEISMQIVAARHENSSPWSSTFTLEQKDDQVQTARVETITIQDPVKNRLYTFKMEIATAPGKHWRTKEIKITPAYILINKTNLTLWYDQYQATQLKTRSPTCFNIKPGERIPYHWSSAKKTDKRFIFTSDEAYQSGKTPMEVCWSVPFKLSKLDSFTFKIRTGPSGTENPGGQDQLIKVQILQRDNVSYIVFRNAPRDTIPFYKIDNRTNYDIIVEQENVSGSRERVPPLSVQNWYWENPLMDAAHRNLTLVLIDNKTLSSMYKANLDRTITPTNEREARDGYIELPSWDLKLRGNASARVRVRLVQQGFVKVLRLDLPTYGQRKTMMLAQANQSSSSDLLPVADDPDDMLKPEEKSLEVSVRICGIGISLIDHFRAKTPSELIYMTLLGISINYNTCKQVHKADLNIQKLQVDNQIKFAPEPVLLTSVRAPLRGAKRSSDMAPFLMTSIEIDSSEESLVYIREMALELQVLDVSVDQYFILAMAGFGESLAKYIAEQSGLEQSVETPETFLPKIEEEELLSPGIFVQALKIYPVKVVLSFAKGRSATAQAISGAPTSNIETLIRRYTSPILAAGSLSRVQAQLATFELDRVNASSADLGLLFAAHYKSEGIANVAKVLFNYVNILKNLTSDPPLRSRIRLPRYFPSDYLVVPFDIAKAYGQNLLVTLASGKYALDIYLSHLWLGGSTKPLLILITTDHIALISPDTGMVWEEKFDTFVEIQVTRPPDYTSKNPKGAVTLFFDKFESNAKPTTDYKHELESIPVEQMAALERTLRTIAKERRSTAHTIHNSNPRGQSLTSSWT